MNSSVKSLVPIVTAGLPLPGWSELAVLEPPPPPPPPPLSSSEPQPAVTATSAVTSNSASRRMRGVFIGRSLLRGGSRSDGRRRRDVGGRHDGLELLRQRQAAWGHGPLHEPEQPVDRERERDDHERRRDDPDEVVGRLLDNNLAETPANRQPCQRGCRDELKPRPAQAGEDQRPGQ